jgi:hypothetical protein
MFRNYGTEALPNIHELLYKNPLDSISCFMINSLNLIKDINRASSYKVITAFLHTMKLVFTGTFEWCPSASAQQMGRENILSTRYRTVTTMIDLLLTCTGQDCGLQSWTWTWRQSENYLRACTTQALMVCKDNMKLVADT